MKTPITGKRVKTIGHGMQSVTLYSEVTGGPAGTVGRELSIWLAPNDVASLAASLASMPAFRGMFRAVADEIDRQDTAGMTRDCMSVNAIHKAATKAIV